MNRISKSVVLVFAVTLVAFTGWAHPPEKATEEDHSHYSLDASDGSPTDVVYVDSVGEVGIGTTNPAYKLDVKGTLRVDSTSYPGRDFRIVVGGRQDVYTNNDYVEHVNGNKMVIVGVAGGYNQDFFVGGGTEGNKIFTIEGDDEEVGIGTTSPQRELDVIGTTRTEVLEITGGSDLAEWFEITSTGSIEPGMVVSIDPERPGQLRVSGAAYDPTVAGILSGAGGIQPGLLMGLEANQVGRFAVALTGQVYCLADASHAPIAPGDLLTTSDIPGHAMKVTAYEKARGAIIGKAMTSLQTGQGMVLVLVTLQ